MIWVRRIFTIPLIIILIAILCLAVLITQVNGTVANPDFYTNQLEKADVYNFVYDEVLPAALDEIDDETSDFPIDISDIEDDIVSAARGAVSPEWLKSQVEAATRTFIPYFVGDTDYFSYTFILKDRVEAAADAVKDNILNSGAFTSIYNDMIPYLAEEIWEGMDEVPSGKRPSVAEMEDSLRDIVTQAWLRSQLESAIDSALPYLTGDSNHFTISIPLQDVFTDAALLELLGEGNEEYLDEAQDWISGEWTYTDADLLDDLKSQDEETLEDARDWIANGYIATEIDLREAISDSDADLDSFDNIRHWIHTGRTWLWALWLLPILLIIGIGFLGGSSWKGRLAWALVALLIAALAVFITTTLVYANVAEPEIDKLLAEHLDPLEYDGLQRVLTEKGNEMIHNTFDSFIAGMKNQTIYMMIAAGAGLLGVAVWYVVDARRRPAKAKVKAKGKAKDKGPIPF